MHNFIIGNNSILIFLPGLNEIYTFIDKLEGFFLH